MWLISIWIEDGQQAHSTRIVGIIVATFIAAIPIYSVSGWSLKRRTITHAAVIAVVVIPCLIISKWFEWQTPMGFMVLLLTYASFGIVGWLIGFVINIILKKIVF
jgi:hypothetical protein